MRTLDSWDHLTRTNTCDRRGIRRLRSPELTVLRHRLAEAQNWRCCYCGDPMHPYDGTKKSASIDHVIPQSKGGGDNWFNLVAACLDCNLKKGDSDGFLFFELIHRQYCLF